MTEVAKTAPCEPLAAILDLPRLPRSPQPDSDEWFARIDDDRPPQAEDLSQLSIDDLLWRMRSADRVAAAEFLHRYGSRIRRRIRGKLGTSVRRMFDSLDIMSTIGRRLDLYVMAGRLQAVDEVQLWKLLFKMADHAMVDKARTVRRVSNAEHEAGEFARQQAGQTGHAQSLRLTSADGTMDTYLNWLDDETDREVLSLWLLGETFVSIGRQLDIAEDTVRKRFRRIQGHLKQRMASVQ